MDQRKKVIEEWKVRIFKAVSRYCETQKINIDALGRTLEIETDPWYDLSRGRRILRTVEYYAMLYQVTKIPEADPRKLPPDETGRSRAWSENAWQKWLENPVVPGKKAASQAVGSRQSTKVFPVKKTQPANKNFSRLELESMSVGELAAILQGQSSRDIGALAEELRGKILSQGQTTAQRNEIAKKYGSVLHQLNNLLDAYEQDDPKIRENILLLMEASDGRQIG